MEKQIIPLEEYLTYYSMLTDVGTRMSLMNQHGLSVSAVSMIVEKPSDDFNFVTVLCISSSWKVCVAKMFIF